MANRTSKPSEGKQNNVSAQPQGADSQKPQRAGPRVLTKSVMKDLYDVYYFLSKDTRLKLELMIKVPVFIKDPKVALENPALGVQEIEVRREAGLADGPTSSRVVIVDYNGDTQQVNSPVAWDEKKRWFYVPLGSGEPLPTAPPDFDIEKYSKMSQAKKTVLQENYEAFIKKAVANPWFHQLNAWAVVQHVLEFYEEPQAMGRPIPWGFDGNRLIVVPHAGYKNNAFYDHASKSLQLYYYGDRTNLCYTCLSHDIIAHETGHAILDGIRPLYLQPTSIQTAAFHEYIGDLTAILLALFNKDLRQFVAEKTKGNMAHADMLAGLARQFAEEVQGRDYLRNAINCKTIAKVKMSLSPHLISQVLTGAMFDILIGITQKHLDKNLPPNSSGGSVDESDAEMDAPVENVEAADGQPVTGDLVTPKEAFWRAADRIRRVALQPLDLCPPCDIQFLDYARAVLRNDILTNPVDEDGYREVILEVFHKRGLCSCSYPTSHAVTQDCQFYEVLSASLYKPRLEMVFHDIENVSRSRTAAYYFLNDNRKALRIPYNRDITVVDLYDTNKYGAAAERQPREIVVEFIWQEPVLLQNQAGGRTFGNLNEKTISLLCGGTLVFNDRGNLLSWFRKPGTEQLDPENEKKYLERKKAWEDDPKNAKGKFKKLTQWEMAELEDLAIGRQRKEALLNHLFEMASLGLIGEAQPGNALLEGMKPLVATVEGGSVRLEQTSALRDFDPGMEAAGWEHSF